MGPDQELAEKRLEHSSEFSDADPVRGPGEIRITSELGRGRTCLTIRPRKDHQIS